MTLAPNTRMHIGFLTLDTARVALEENYLSDGTFAGLSGLSTPAGKLTRLDVQVGPPPASPITPKPCR